MQNAFPKAQSAPFNSTLAVLYGQFINAAYTMYGNDPGNLTPQKSADFPAGYTIAAWVVMKDFIFESTNPVFYGFIARSTAAPSQHILAIRGTAGWVEWWDDLNSLVLVPFKDGSCGQVGSGFARIYDTMEVLTSPVGASADAVPQHSLKSVGSFAHQVAAVVGGLAAAAPGAAPKVVPPVAVAGHSLGAALATLYVQDNTHFEDIPISSIYTFASPRVGDATFAAVFNALNLPSWRIDNYPDLVPYLPPGFTHVDTLQQYDSGLSVLPTPACWHSLTTYLSLVDPMLQSAPGCQWPWQGAQARRAAPSAALASADVSRSISVPAGPVTVNITVNVGKNES